MLEERVRVMRLHADDAEAVSALARRIWQVTYPALISQAQIDAMLADRYAPDRIRAQAGDPGHAWFVAHRETTLVGFAHAAFDDADCKLDKLYVDPEHQRHGVGTELMAAVEDWARRRAARRVWLQVNRGNARAIAAYRKYGFAIVEARVFDIGDGFVMDDYVMEKPL